MLGFYFFIFYEPEIITYYMHQQRTIKFGNPLLRYGLLQTSKQENTVPVISMSSKDERENSVLHHQDTFKICIYKYKSPFQNICLKGLNRYESLCEN
jgi:hypothetical protein